MIAFRFNAEELRALCLDFNVDYENLGGDGKLAKALRLVSHMDHRGRSDELIKRLNESRPEDAWPTM